MLEQKNNANPEVGCRKINDTGDAISQEEPIIFETLKLPARHVPKQTNGGSMVDLTKFDVTTGTQVCATSKLYVVYPPSLLPWGRGGGGRGIL